jgi:hypothetical protein
MYAQISEAVSFLQAITLNFCMRFHPRDTPLSSILILLGKKYKLRTFPLCRFLCTPVISVELKHCRQYSVLEQFHSESSTPTQKNAENYTTSML